MRPSAGERPLRGTAGSIGGAVHEPATQSAQGERISRGRHGIRQRGAGPVLGLLLAAVLLVGGCGGQQEIVYVDSNDHATSGNEAYTPIGRTTDARVHPDGAHHPAPVAAIGGEPAGDRDAAYAPIASNDGPLVHTGDPHQVMPPIVLAHERDGATSAGHAAPASTAEGAANAAPARAVTAHGVPAQELAAASPTPPARLSLGAALGARAGTPFLDGVSIAHEDEVEFTAVTGRVESIVGQLLTVQTAAGPSRVNLADGVRVDRDARGSAADLKPGQFVGVTHPPSGPASSVRLYATEPGMPRPGVVPQVGAWQGQVTTFGSVVALRPGGLLLNAGSQTASIELPSTVEILKPAPSVPADLGVGMQIMATGPVTGDGIVAATAVRVTVPGAPGR